MMQQFFLLCLCLAAQLYSGARGSSAPFISGDTFRAHAQHVFDETRSEFHPDKVKRNDIIFVKTDETFLDAFFSKYHPKITSPYILITHNSDHGAPGRFAKYLSDPKLLAWYGQNLDGTIHPKLHPIPIGIANKCWDHGNPKIFSDFLYSEDVGRPFFCYLNFAIATYVQERGYIFNLIKDEFWVTKSTPKPLQFYLQDLKSSKFVLSPRGNGLDCHRTWEALLMGAIPIVRTSPLDPLFEDLPVLIIDNWEQVTEKFLIENYETMKQKKYNLEKLFINYWINKIRAIQ